MSKDFLSLFITKTKNAPKIKGRPRISKHFTVLKKNDKEDTFGDTNKLYYFTKWSFSGNCKMGPKAGCFYRIMNKEQGRGK